MYLNIGSNQCIKIKINIRYIFTELQEDCRNVGAIRDLYAFFNSENISFWCEKQLIHPLNLMEYSKLFLDVLIRWFYILTGQFLK